MDDAVDHTMDADHELILSGGDTPTSKASESIKSQLNSSQSSASCSVSSVNSGTDIVIVKK